MARFHSAQGALVLLLVLLLTSDWSLGLEELLQEEESVRSEQKVLAAGHGHHTHPSRYPGSEDALLYSCALQGEWRPIIQDQHLKPPIQHVKGLFKLQQLQPPTFQKGQLALSTLGSSLLQEQTFNVNRGKRPQALHIHQHAFHRPQEQHVLAQVDTDLPYLFDLPVQNHLQGHHSYGASSGNSFQGVHSYGGSSVNDLQGHHSYGGSSGSLQGVHSYGGSSVNDLQGHHSYGGISGNQGHDDSQGQHAFAVSENLVNNDLQGHHSHGGVSEHDLQGGGISGNQVESDLQNQELALALSGNQGHNVLQDHHSYGILSGNLQGEQNTFAQLPGSQGHNNLQEHYMYGGLSGNQGHNDLQGEYGGISGSQGHNNLQGEYGGLSGNQGHNSLQGEYGGLSGNQGHNELQGQHAFSQLPAIHVHNDFEGHHSYGGLSDNQGQKEQPGFIQLPSNQVHSNIQGQYMLGALLGNQGQHTYGGNEIHTSLQGHHALSGFAGNQKYQGYRVFGGNQVHYNHHGHHKQVGYHKFIKPGHKVKQHGFPGLVGYMSPPPLPPPTRQYAPVIIPLSAHVQTPAVQHIAAAAASEPELLSCTASGHYQVQESDGPGEAALTL